MVIEVANSEGGACSICQHRPHSGLHYGVLICEAGKQFLKRTFHQQLVYQACMSRACCPPRPRGRCQACRLAACLSLPLQVDLVRQGHKQDHQEGGNQGRGEGGPEGD